MMMMKKKAIGTDIIMGLLMVAVVILLSVVVVITTTQQQVQGQQQPQGFPDTARNSFMESDEETEAMLIELAVAQIRNMTDPMITLSEDGSLIIMESPTISLKIVSATVKHPFTPENGYDINGGILYAPNGSQIFP
jgi:hypothetical protein